jgi:hypothetical protein
LRSRIEEVARPATPWRPISPSMRACSQDANLHIEGRLQTAALHAPHAASPSWQSLPGGCIDKPLQAHATAPATPRAEHGGHQAATAHKAAILPYVFPFCTYAWTLGRPALHAKRDISDQASE